MIDDEQKKEESNDILAERCALVREVITETGHAWGHIFDNRFYERMMEKKQSGRNLWFTPQEEQFYRAFSSIAVAATVSTSNGSVEGETKGDDNDDSTTPS